MNIRFFNTVRSWPAQSQTVTLPVASHVSLTHPIQDSIRFGQNGVTYAEGDTDNQGQRKIVIGTAHYLIGLQGTQANDEEYFPLFKQDNPNQQVGVIHRKTPNNPWSSYLIPTEHTQNGRVQRVSITPRGEVN